MHSPVEAKALIFDCDGTLLNTMPLHWSAWCAICRETGLRFNKESFYALAGVPGREIIRELANQQGIVLDPMEVYARKKAFFLNGLKSVRAIPCVVQFALEARRTGIPTAVASGSSRAQVEQGTVWTIGRSKVNLLFVFHKFLAPALEVTSKRKYSFNFFVAFLFRILFGHNLNTRFRAYLHVLQRI